MCLDLFGDVVVTVYDVNVWLDTVPKLRGESATRRKYYAQYNDVANKIKLWKLSGQFDLLIEQYESMQQTQHIDLYDPLYIDIDYKKITCPAYFHICNVQECDIFINRMKRSHYRELRVKYA